MSPGRSSEALCADETSDSMSHASTAKSMMGCEGGGGTETSSRFSCFECLRLQLFLSPPLPRPPPHLVLRLCLGILRYSHSKAGARHHFYEEKDLLGCLAVNFETKRSLKEPWSRGAGWCRRCGPSCHHCRRPGSLRAGGFGQTSTKQHRALRSTESGLCSRCGSGTFWNPSDENPSPTLVPPPTPVLAGSNLPPQVCRVLHRPSSAGQGAHGPASPAVPRVLPRLLRGAVRHQHLPATRLTTRCCRRCRTSSTTRRLRRCRPTKNR